MTTSLSLVFAALAAALHAFIFVLESFRWTDEHTRKVFSIASAEEAEATREMAFNQGFYNLFLGVITIAGVVLVCTGSEAPGRALVAAGTCFMLAAGLVLFVGSPDKRAAAVKQMAFPALSLVFLATGLL